MNTRRRGAELENAILQSAWQVLLQDGFQNFTIEKVAIQAATSKPVIYRRWANREALVLDTIQKNTPKPITQTPNTGDVRGDLIIVMQNLSDYLIKIGPDTLHGLMSVLSDIPLYELIHMRKTNTMQIILKRAIERGEIKAEKLSERIANLPIDLIRHELLITYQPVTKKTITEIIDDIFLPLVQ